MKLIVWGTGYVGLITGICLAEKGNKVICIDNDREKIKNLKLGKLPIHEKDCESLLKKNIEKGLLKFKHNNEKFENNVDAIFICVGTPEGKNGEANLEFVYESIIEILKKIDRDCVIIIKSTVPVGTTRKIKEYINENLKRKINIDVVSNPEFLSQGNAIEDMLHIQRIIIGAENKKSINLMKEIYCNFKQKKIITSYENAEMIKYSSNSFLAMKISYINSIANLCEKVGADIQVVSKGMGMDKRIGKFFLNAGIGYGGSCFPKDTKAIIRIAEENDVQLQLIRDTIEINEKQNIILLKKAKKYYKSFKGINVAMLGLTFKPNTDDCRGAPAMKNLKILLEQGANITFYDPMVNSNKFFNKDIILAKSIEDTIINKDICFIFNECEQIKNFDINKFKELMKKPIILDGRNCYDKLKMKKMKIEYVSIGR